MPDGGVRVYGYIRCSHVKSERSGLSPKTQKRIIESWFRTLRHKPEYRRLRRGRIFRDRAKSAGSTDLLLRSGGRALDAALRPGDHVIFPVLDRGFRNQLDCLRTIKLWESRKITVHLAGQELDLTTSSGRLHLHIQGVFAEYEYLVACDRAQNAKAECRRLGRPLNQHPAIGWKTDRSGGRHKLMLVKDLRARRWAEEVKRLRDDLGLSYDDIVARMIDVVAPDFSRCERVPLEYRIWSEIRIKGLYRAALEKFPMYRVPIPPIQPRKRHQILIRHLGVNPRKYVGLVLGLPRARRNDYRVQRNAWAIWVAGEVLTAPTEDGEILPICFATRHAARTWAKRLSGCDQGETVGHVRRGEW